MPRLKAVRPLYEQCKLAVNSLIQHYCQITEKEHGNYDQTYCQVFINRMQRYLLSNLPGHVIDDLYNSLVTNYIVKLQLNESKSDRRILLSIYLHSNMRIFGLELPVVQFHTMEFYRWLCDDSYWISKIRTMTKLVVLDLRLACTDEILEVVGKTCSMLEVINIVSKSVSCENSMNALKLKFFVSDVGLGHLSQCKKLRKIIMNKFIKANCGGRMVTQNGIGDLIKSLPQLQYISYTDVGTIVSSLVNEVKELPIVHVTDYHSNRKNMEAIVKLCPNLQEITLSQPVSSYNNNEAHEVVKTLTKSNLQLSLVEFKFFPVVSSLENFLTVKGSFLTTLTISPLVLVSSNELLTVGKYCCNIEHFDIKNLTKNDSDFKNLYLSQREPIFTKLKHLLISGAGWLPEIVVPLCLRYANHLVRFNFDNSLVDHLMDDVFNDVLDLNSLPDLKVAFLSDGCLITVRTIVKLMSSCPELRRLLVYPHACLTDTDIQGLLDKIREKNLDFKLICY